MKRVHSNIEHLSIINGCSDEYTVVPIEDITKEYIEKKSQREDIITLGYWMIAAVVINILVVEAALLYRLVTRQLL